ALELSGVPDGNKTLARWGNRLSTVQINTDATGGQGYIYPGISLTSFDVIGLSLTTMSSDIPYARSTQTQRAADQYSPAFDWERNSFSSAPGAAVIRDDRFLQTGRSSLQTITNKGSASIIGWAPNPYPFNSYLVGGREDPSALLGGHFVAGQAVQLRAEQNPNDASLQYTRVRQLEKLAVAGLDIGLLRSEGVLPEFNLDVLDGRQYNLVSFATRFSATQEPIVASTTLRRWQANGSSITERMDGALGRLTLIRRGDGVVTSPTPSTGGETLTVQPEPSFIWSNSQYIARHVGRLKLTRDLSGKNQLGAATPSGDLLAFTLDNSDEGQGMLLGVARANSAPSFSSARYQLQGLSLGMTDDANILRQYNDSRLVLNGSSAQLTLKRIAVNHSLAAGTVSDPQDSSFDAVLGGTLNVDAAEHLVRATITVDGSPLALEGFASADQSFIVFRLQHGPHLGLILALRD
ncbi:MAG: hypothetical protein LPK85_10200, partial [Gammaproteobacteria bacterium]|nr:hypothetical protein [Gammaproteobacteria bacterium]